MAVKNSQEQEIDIISDFIEMSIIVEVGFIIFLKDLYGLYRVWEESNKLIKLMPKYPCKPRLEHGPWGTGFFFHSCEWDIKFFWSGKFWNWSKANSWSGYVWDSN